MHKAAGSLPQRCPMRSTFFIPIIGCLALALAGCRDDPTGTPPSSLMAARHESDDPPRFSAWSAPVNLGPPVNTAFIEQAASLSRDGRSLYFHCGNRSEEHTSELQSQSNLVCRLLLEKKKQTTSEWLS